MQRDPTEKLRGFTRKKVDDDESKDWHRLQLALEHESHYDGTVDISVAGFRLFAEEAPIKESNLKRADEDKNKMIRYSK